MGFFSSNRDVLCVMNSEENVTSQSPKVCCAVAAFVGYDTLFLK